MARPTGLRGLDERGAGVFGTVGLEEHEAHVVVDVGVVAAESDGLFKLVEGGLKGLLAAGVVEVAFARVDAAERGVRRGLVGRDVGGALEQVAGNGEIILAVGDVGGGHDVVIACVGAGRACERLSLGPRPLRPKAAGSSRECT